MKQPLSERRAPRKISSAVCGNTGIRVLCIPFPPPGGARGRGEMRLGLDVEQRVVVALAGEEQRQLVEDDRHTEPPGSGNQADDQSSETSVTTEEQKKRGRFLGRFRKRRITDRGELPWRYHRRGR